MFDKKRFYFLPVIFLVGLLMLPSAVFAAAFGQIKGTITDAETGEPVVNASVLIVGTRVGNFTDLDGKYIIPRLEPGTYTVKISSIEYNTVEITNVIINADLTTEVSQKMTRKVSDLDKTIVVTGKQDVIDRFETENKLTITQETIKHKPVQTVDALLSQVAGVQTTTTGEVFIRGGRAGEISYIVDGVPIGDPLGGIGQTGANLSLVSGSIQEIQIIKDGFDPEYGDALSGIVKISTQTGSKDNTRLNFQYITDDLGNAKLNKYSRNYNYARFSISGPDPIFKNKVLPALGLNFLEDKELTYYFYAEVDKDDGFYQYNSYDTPKTRNTYAFFDLFGIKVPERLNNRYYWMGNIKFRPKQNMKFILSYKNSQRHGTGFGWDYRYSSATAPVWEEDWKSLSLEVSQSISKDMNYELVLSYYTFRYNSKPGDPNNPGRGLSPEEFTLDSEWESFQDRNGNGVYDAPEPIINLYPDSTSYGTDFNGPAYTFGELLIDQNIQGSDYSFSSFRFNNNGYIDDLEGEPFIDINGNGVWDAGDILYDKNGNGLLDAGRVSNINNRTPEPYTDGDSILGEPFTDINGNGVYDAGIDIFIRSTTLANHDLNHNGRYDGPCQLGTPGCNWEPGIPFLDRNGNGVFDGRNYQYDPGEPYEDINGNGRYDYGGSYNFLDPLNYSQDVSWSQREIERLRGEIKIFRQLGPHELKGGFAFRHESFTFEDIERVYILYTGRYDGGPYPDRGAFRDVFNYSPMGGTGYIRDKLEYGSMIASLGIRWDFFIQDTDSLIEVARNDDLGSGIIYGDRHKISPRIGFSYPISDKAKVHFNYGHFYQLPDYRYMYARNTSSVDQNDVVGNYNLDYQKTIQYSFGVKYAMTEFYSLDISGYFKDEFDKINSKQVKVGGLTRQQYRNSDYGRSRGFEITLEKRGGGYVNGQVNYTYAFAYGKASQANEDYLSDFYLSREPLSEAPMDNDIRHSLKSAIQIYIPNTVKPRVFGLPIPNGWSLSIESIIESGRPFTPDRNYPNISQETAESIERNSLRYPSTVVFDIRFNKDFSLFGLEYSFICWVENVFDSRNVT
ncbi:MAG: TonB-dependent receptor, partial [candidate division Zixibacteria bacterium]|nr:TonB-dependent receptor [candidate division Zixibacteria bacterium]